jgi:hypothetical protein
VEPLDLSLGLGVVGLSVLDVDAQGGELCLEAAPSVSELSSKDATVICQYRSGKSPSRRSFVEGRNDVSGGRHR